MPAAAMWWLFGIQSTPPETAVVPPTFSDFSSTTTLAPPSWAARAAVSPAPPEPTTTTSASTSHLRFLSNHMREVRSARGVARGAIAAHQPPQVGEPTLVAGADVEWRRGVAHRIQPRNGP